MFIVIVNRPLNTTITDSLNDNYNKGCFQWLNYNFYRELKQFYEAAIKAERGDPPKEYMHARRHNK